tara:strand:- start:235 stop:666 length:432 start_codon:yes stop_codon:yes gene_type:complete
LGTESSHDIRKILFVGDKLSKLARSFYPCDINAPSVGALAYKRIGFRPFLPRICKYHMYIRGKLPLMRVENLPQHVAGCPTAREGDDGWPFDFIRISHQLPLRMDVVIVPSHVPEDAILEAPQVGGEAVEVGRVEVQRPVRVV